MFKNIQTTLFCEKCLSLNLEEEFISSFSNYQYAYKGIIKIIFRINDKYSNIIKSLWNSIRSISLFERYLCKFNIYKKLSQETIKKIGRKIITFNAMISNQNQRKIHSITSKQINNLNK